MSVAVIVLNWNGFRDTIFCLESLLPNLAKGDRILVCDNASSDESIARICEWADSSQSLLSGRGWVLYDREQAELGGAADDPVLVIVQTGANLGFAGGNNVGVRYALKNGFSYVWLLNNDTVVGPKSLSALLECMNADASLGMCGSTLVYHDDPSTVQALGGARFDFSRGIGTHLGIGEQVGILRDRNKVEAAIDYVVGASILVSRAFLEEVGLMDEGYFLYFEEIDWAMRAKGVYRLGWAPGSVVAHKEGSSIGSSHHSRPSSTALRYMYRNRLLFARRHTRYLFWSVWRCMAYELVVYLKRRDWEAALIIFAAMIGRGVE